MAGVTRAGLDIALIVLAVLACWQLRQFSAVGASGTGGIDPVLVLAPALALAAGSVVVLRLLPLAAVDWTGWPPVAAGCLPRWPRGSSAGCRSARGARRCCW